MRLCDLYIRGSKDEIKRFKDFAESIDNEGEKNVLDTNNFIPYPKDYEDMDNKKRDWNEKADEFAKKNGCKVWWCGDELSETLRNEFLKENPEPEKDGFNSGGYEWCSKNWGTKWGICRAELYETEEELQYNFECAWSIPEPVIKKMSELFPLLNFELRYFEGGMGFNGLLEYENGKEIENKCGDYFGNRGG